MAPSTLDLGVRLDDRLELALKLTAELSISKSNLGPLRGPSEVTPHLGLAIPALINCEFHQLLFEHRDLEAVQKLRLHTHTRIKA